MPTQDFKGTITFPSAGGAITAMATAAEVLAGTEAAKATAPAVLSYIKGRPNLENLLYPSQNGGWRDIVRAGWKPAFFNQQWGGAPSWVGWMAT